MILTLYFWHAFYILLLTLSNKNRPPAPTPLTAPTPPTTSEVDNTSPTTTTTVADESFDFVNEPLVLDDPPISKFIMQYVMCV